MHFPGVRKHERAKWAYRRCKAPRWWLMGVGAGGGGGERQEWQPTLLRATGTTGERLTLWGVHILAQYETDGNV